MGSWDGLTAAAAAAAAGAEQQAVVIMARVLVAAVVYSRTRYIRASLQGKQQATQQQQAAFSQSYEGSLCKSS